MTAFIVWCPQSGQEREDGRTVIAQDPEDAAEKWAERTDCESAEYSIVGGSAASVLVADGDAVHAFVVSGESVAVYTARRAR